MQRANVAAKAFMAGRDAMTQGDFEMALTAFRWARRADSGNPVYIHAEATLARKMHNFHESENLYRRVIDVAVRAFGARDPRTATIALGLSELYEEMGRHDQARDLCARIVDNLDREAAAMGGIQSLARITLICQRAGRLDEAMRIHLRAVAYRRGVFGDRHYKIGECVIGIAALKELMKAREVVGERPKGIHPACYPRQTQDSEAVMVN
jgi:tetratricopeptide (TPR) repeat protein